MVPLKNTSSLHIANSLIVCRFSASLTKRRNATPPKVDTLFSCCILRKLLCKYRLNDFYPFIDFFGNFRIALVQAQTEHSAASFHAGERKFISAGAYIADEAGAAEAKFVIEVRRSGTEAVGMAFLTSDTDDCDVFTAKINGVQQFYVFPPIFH